MTVQFTIIIQGSGDTIDDCWNDATEGFSLETGVTPDEGEYVILEEDGDEEEDKES